MVRPLAGCVAPGEIEPGDLVAFATGEAGTAVTQHMQRCTACRSEAESYTGTQKLLTSKLFRQSCPPSLTIGEYAAELLPPDERLSVARHLADCPHCREERRGFSTFLAEPDEPYAEPGLAGALRRILALRLQPARALAGLRGAASGESVSYDAEGIGLTISVQRGAPGARANVVTGLLQAGPESLAGSRAALFAGSRLVQMQDVDGVGSFLFDDVSAGTYRLEVSVTDAVVVIDPLAVS